MRLYADSQQQAQDFCDRAYVFLQQTQPEYALNMERWATPSQDDLGQWFMLFEESVRGAFTDQELTRLADI